MVDVSVWQEIIYFRIPCQQWNMLWLKNNLQSCLYAAPTDSGTRVRGLLPPHKYLEEKKRKKMIFTEWKWGFYMLLIQTFLSRNLWGGQQWKLQLSEQTVTHVISPPSVKIFFLIPWSFLAFFYFIHLFVCFKPLEASSSEKIAIIHTIKFIISALKDRNTETVLRAF